ncbi:MAG: hypothetical protein LBT73_03000 [Tannerellaceae bacterium]|jgi:hypothetical protein|nr:hypothetical protein [Tannerellaceae bacterium]
MKHFITMAAIATLASCAQDTPSVTPEPVDPNAPTTYSFKLEAETDNFPEAMSAYFDEETGECKLIAKHGNLVPFIATDTVEMPEYHSPIYLFYGDCLRLTASFTPERGKHTVFVISTAALGDEGITGIFIAGRDKTVYTWPH